MYIEVATDQCDRDGLGRFCIEFIIAAQVHRLDELIVLAKLDTLHDFKIRSIYYQGVTEIVRTAGQVRNEGQS